MHPSHGPAAPARAARVPTLLVLSLVLAAVPAWTSPARAQVSPQVGPLTLSAGTGTYDVAPHLAVRPDPAGRLTLADVAGGLGFAPAPAGLTPAAPAAQAYWARVVLAPERGVTHGWYLTVAADHVQLYQRAPDGTWATRRTGFRVPTAERDVKRALPPMLHLAVTPGRLDTLYLRVEHRFNTYVGNDEPVVPVLETAEVVTTRDRGRRLAHGLFVGFMLAIIGYNFFLFVAVRDRSFLFYVVFLGAFTLFWTIHAGVPQELWWPASMPTLPNAVFGIIPVGFSSYLLFTMFYLRTRRHAPRLHAVLGLLIGATVVPPMMAVLGAWGAAQQAMAVLALLVLAATLLSSIVTLRRGYGPAGYYLAAGGLFILGTIVYVLTWFGLLPVSALTANSMQLGSALEALLLSFGLGSRINLLQDEKQRVEMEAQRAEVTTRALQEANDLKTQLLSIAAHDLRNPLGAIQGFADILREELPPYDRRQEAVGIIRDSAARMLDLLNDLLNTSAIESGQMELDLQPVHLGQLAMGVVRGYEVRARQKEQVLHLHVADRGLPVRGDEVRLREAMDNLVSNAVKYAPLHSSIDVTVKARDGWIRFAVADEGPGLTPPDRDKLFQRFQRLSARPTKGESSTGLGLAITKAVIELHGGTIDVESRPGEGSTFYFDLPVFESASATSYADTVRATP